MAMEAGTAVTRIMHFAFMALALLGVTAHPAAAQKADAETRTVTVFAAASLKNALEAVSAAFAATGGKAVASYAASSALAKQIEQGAPADIFVSADLDWMDYLAGKGLINPDTRAELLGNTLVLVAPKSSTLNISIEPGMKLAEALGADGRLAVAETSSVPAGKYAKEALQSLGVWTTVENRLAPTENVRAALALVSLGETPFGIVYRTDAMADANVRIAGTFPASSHKPIVYPVAAVKGGPNGKEAEAYLHFLRGPAARGIFEKQGFEVLAKP